MWVVSKEVVVHVGGEQGGSKCTACVVMMMDDAR
jgi:hypothetical protein